MRVCAPQHLVLCVKDLTSTTTRSAPSTWLPVCAFVSECGTPFICVRWPCSVCSCLHWFDPTLPVQTVRLPLLSVSTHHMNSGPAEKHLCSLVTENILPLYLCRGLLVFSSANVYGLTVYTVCSMKSAPKYSIYSCLCTHTAVNSDVCKDTHMKDLIQGHFVHMGTEGSTEKQVLMF